MCELKTKLFCCIDTFLYLSTMCHSTLKEYNSKTTIQSTDSRGKEWLCRGPHFILVPGLVQSCSYQCLTFCLVFFFPSRAAVKTKCCNFNAFVLLSFSCPSLLFSCKANKAGLICSALAMKSLLTVMMNHLLAFSRSNSSISPCFPSFVLSFLPLPCLPSTFSPSTVRKRRLEGGPIFPKCRTNV